MNIFNDDEGSKQRSVKCLSSICLVWMAVWLQYSGLMSSSGNEIILVVNWPLAISYLIKS